VGVALIHQQGITQGNTMVGNTDNQRNSCQQ